LGKDDEEDGDKGHSVSYEATVGAWYLSGTLDNGGNNGKADRDTVDESELGGGDL
jgi:hypothetical protein